MGLAGMVFSMISIAVGAVMYWGVTTQGHGFRLSTVGVILMVVAFQLALTGLHELSEAMWIWSSKTEMAVIGPIVRNEIFFFVVILGAAALLVLREFFSAERRLRSGGVDHVAQVTEASGGGDVGRGSGGFVVDLACSLE